MEQKQNQTAWTNHRLGFESEQFDMTKCVKVLRAKAKAKSMDQSQARIWVGTV
jgi:hypothetical protein